MTNMEMITLSIYYYHVKYNVVLMTCIYVIIKKLDSNNIVSYKRTIYFFNEFIVLNVLNACILKITLILNVNIVYCSQLNTSMQRRIKKFIKRGGY